MNWNCFSLGASIVIGCFANYINNAANESYRRNAMTMAEAQRSEETLEKIKECEKTISLANDVRDRESKEIGKELTKWELETNYGTKVRDIHDTAKNELILLKESVNYDTRKEEIERIAEDAIEDVKDSLDYDNMMAIYNGNISSADSAYKRKEKLYDLASSSDDDDTVSELKKIEKKKMQETIDAAKSKKTELNTKLEKEKTRIMRQKNSDLRALESELSPGKSAISQKEREALEAVNKERNAVWSDIQNSVIDKRTETEIQALNNKWDSQKYIDNQKLQNTKNSVDIYRNASTSEKWGKYLKSNDVPKWFVAFIAALPLIPAGFLMEKYVKFVIGTIKAM